MTRVVHSKDARLTWLAAGASSVPTVNEKQLLRHVIAIFILHRSQIENLARSPNLWDIWLLSLSSVCYRGSNTHTGCDLETKPTEQKKQSKILQKETLFNLGFSLHFVSSDAFLRKKNLGMSGHFQGQSSPHSWLRTLKHMMKRHFREPDRQTESERRRQKKERKGERPCTALHNRTTWWGTYHEPFSLHTPQNTPFATKRTRFCRKGPRQPSKADGIQHLSSLVYSFNLNGRWPILRNRRTICCLKWSLHYHEWSLLFTLY